MLNTVTYDGMIDRVKSALLGDLKDYSNSNVQMTLSQRSLRDLDRQQSFGRGYSASYEPTTCDQKPAAKGLSVMRIFRALRSIGEYDLERTR